MDMGLKERLENIRHAYSCKESLPITIASSLVIGFIMFYFTNIEAIWWDFGKAYAITLILLQITIATLFGINLTLLWNKLSHASKIDKGEAGSTTIASILSVIVSGCPACGVTLASYLGLASFISAFPLYGLELKFIGAFLLLFSIFSLSKGLFACKVDFKENKKVKKSGN